MLKLSRLPHGEPEIFTSIQGEGVSIGVPSVFVRLSLCNLRCTWCDTSYTWDWRHYNPREQILSLSVEEVAHRVERMGGQTIRNVVITGGEPLLQQRQLADLAALLKASNRRIEIETNGTVTPERSLASLIDQWNVSPKLENSGNGCAKREVAPALEWFAACPSAFFKFVVAAEADVEEVHAFRRRYALPADHVLLMPEGRDPATINRRSWWLAERCLEHGYRFTSRLHILLWGDQRGR